MKSKRSRALFAATLASLMLLSALVAGCATTAPAATTAAATAASTSAAATTAAQATATAAVQATTSTNTPLTLDIFDNAANYQGTQPGWFAIVVKNKFNITLNILAPQISGDQLYQTRAAAGDLGDIAIIDNAQWVDCIPAGLISDLTDLIPKYSNLNKYIKHFQVFNSSFSAANGKIYGMPDFEADTSPTTFSDFQPYSSPELYWPYYKELGMPEIKDLNGLIDVLAKIQKAHPTTKDGKTSIPITLWKDWDTNYMEAACWIGQWYGYQCDNTCSSVLLGSDGKIIPLSDDTGSYKKALQFLFDANQKGLVDQDSPSQQWMKVNEKYTNGQVDLMWYSWATGFYNTVDKAKNGDGWIVVPIDDLNISQTGDAYYGSGRVWCLGAKAKDPARTMEFIDWLNGTEGMRYVNDGIENFVYEKGADGKFKYTTLGWGAFTTNAKVPADLGGGGYQDGISAINTCIMGSLTTDPDTGEFYDANHWAATIEQNKSTLKNEWTARFGAANPTEYFLQHKNMTVVLNVNADLGKDTSDIKTIRSQCAQIVKDTSWQMVFAKDQASFDKLWTSMKTQLTGLGWDDLVKFDTAKSQKKVDLRNAGAK
jgi:putative aldouronate transport system substrate-binding protein